jgi:flavin-dependent dehydrogenase
MTASAGDRYDVIVVGARCAGAPTAMLLARRGHRVLLLDRDRFPSNMPHSTHLVHPMGVARLKQWGVLDAIAARTPPLPAWSLDLHGVLLEGPPPAVEGSALSYAPRRELLDEVLVRAAVDAGAELREGCLASDLLFDDGRVVGVRTKGATGKEFSASATLVVGADGPASAVAASVGAAERDTHPIIQSNIWSYWEGVPLPEVRLFIREKAGGFAFATSDGATLVAANLMYDDFLVAKDDRPRAYHAMLNRVTPALAAMLREARQVDRFYAGCTRAFVRQSAGPGWALVGDAGMKKDPVTAQGITCAFEGAVRLADAIDAGLSGSIPLDEALAGYERWRDDWLMPFYHFTARLSAFGAPSAEQRRLYEALRDSPEDRGALFGTVSLSVSPDRFFAAENVRRIIEGART